jgi:hypothetical protein
VPPDVYAFVNVEPFKSNVFADTKMTRQLAAFASVVPPTPVIVTRSSSRNVCATAVIRISPEPLFAAPVIALISPCSCCCCCCCAAVPVAHCCCCSLE